MKLYSNEFKTEMSIKQRVIKLQLLDDSWRTFFGISNQRFVRLLIKHQPINVYRSVSSWVMFSEHPTYKNILLQSDILIDCDEETRMDEIKKLMKKGYPELKLIHELETSEKHYHLIYNHKIQPKLEPNERERYHKTKKEQITEYLLQMGFKIDSQVGKDLFRVRRVENTWNKKKNYLCHSLGNFTGLELTPLSSEMMTKKGGNLFPLYKEPKREHIKATVPLHYFYNFISNSVPNTKGLSIPMIKWDSLKKKLLKKTIKQFNLGSFLHIKTIKNTYILFFNAFSKRKLEKIYQFAKSNSYLEFKKYKWNWVCVKGDDNFPIKMTFFENEGAKGNYSSPHLNFFGLDVKGIKCGAGKLRVYKAEKKVENDV